MSSRSAALASAAVLLTGASAFVGSSAPSQESRLLRGSKVGATPSAQAPSSSSVLPTGIAAAALVFGVSSSRRKQGSIVRFAAGKASSYKEFKDPWLGSADFGFDPLNVAVGSGIFDKGEKAVPETTYYNYRESEVKHGRFAMIAFLAIFAESADRGALLAQLGQAGAVDRLDGTLGLDEVQAPVLAIGLGIQALAEFNLQKSEDDGDILSVQYKKERIPGNLGFDPLGLGKGDSVKDLHNTEINAGRLAMIGITSFLLKEFVVKDPAIAAMIL